MAAGKTKKAAASIESKFCQVCGVADRSMHTFGAGPAKTGPVDHGYCPDHMPRLPDGSPMYGVKQS